jgi:hypothetical protein
MSGNFDQAIKNGYGVGKPTWLALCQTNQNNWTTQNQVR